MKRKDFLHLKATEDFGADPHPDPYQNVTDPEHCLKYVHLTICHVQW